MKNKKIEEIIQNRIDDIYQSGEYISQAKELEEILECIKQLQQENQQLKKQKDDVVEYIKENKDKTISPYGDNEDIDFEVCLFEEDINELLRMLGEIDVED